jgi:hypothetical protein
MNNVTSARKNQSLVLRYPLSNSRIHLIDLIIVSLLKICLLTFSYLVLIFYFGKPYFPIMVDQVVYYSDITRIMDDATFLLKPDSLYWSLNTFYSRLLGLIGLFVLFVDPFVIVVSVNLILSILIALYSVKIYDILVPENYISQRKIFYIICISPMLNVYCLLILRDILITFLCVLFIYYMLKNNLIIMISLLFLLLFARPYLAILFMFVLIISKIANWTFSLRFSWFYFSFMGFFILILLLMFMHYFGIENVSYALNNLENRLEGKDIARIFALGGLTAGNTKLIAQNTTSFIRIGTIDGIVLPIFVYLIIIPLFLKANKQLRIFIVTIVAIHFSAAIAYLTTLNSFTARKLLMVMPFFYVLIFIYFNLRRKRHFDILSKVAVRKFIT